MGSSFRVKIKKIDEGHSYLTLITRYRHEVPDLAFNPIKFICYILIFTVKGQDFSYKKVDSRKNKKQLNSFKRINSSFITEIHHQRRKGPYIVHR